MKKRCPVLACLTVVAVGSHAFAQATTELADLFCIQARRRIEVLFAALWHNDDDANYAAAQKLLDGRYAWVEEGLVDPSGDGPLIAGQVGAAPDDRR